MTSAAFSPSTILRKTQTLPIFSLPSTSTSTSTFLHFPPQPLVVIVGSRKYRRSSFPRLYGAASQARPEEEDEEDTAIGDCLVFEEGVFDDPFLQTPRESSNDGHRVSRRTKERGKDAAISPENLIPEKWLDVQRELNMTKKEKRILSRQLEYGRRVEKKRQALRPINPVEYEAIKLEKLKQLKPVVLDNPKLDYAEESKKHEDGDRQVVAERVAPRNPRLAVYGGGLDDISAFFTSGSYAPGTADKPQGSRRLFSKEERALMNRRVPDLGVSTSGKWHPLHTLAASGEFYLVNSLLKQCIDINAPDKDGLAAIHKAILAKKQAVFNFLLRESANPFTRDTGGATLMHYAVLTASSQMIKILLLYNVDINLQDKDGWTPLHLAVQSRRTDIVRLLLIKGADKNLKNRDGLTALDLCLYAGRDIRTYELIKLLKRIPQT
ncbi:ankyrin repeat domain-containing protein, chloroplastic isoform X2 [Andrographis paniculata]|uniref:ankyrin repeat domain-containing protein, chloroplastic isoform X2 n=1 Tax=Andrographis paniculata TaxID=175694 RepID=UPI0021E783E3|nr:ankyrin repeat domain-containing protein, chloroplastic isoform X2 [Andrographis paniculata]